jgi:hypothetical protein
MDDGPERLASGREAEKRRGDRGRCLLTPDDAGRFELAETCGEQIRGDPGQAISHVSVSTRSTQQQLTMSSVQRSPMTSSAFASAQYCP